MADEQTREMGSTLVPLTIGPMVYGYRFSENAKLWYGNSLYNLK
jgi:hypothetical protein